LTPNAIRVEPGLRPSDLRAGAWSGWVLLGGWGWHGSQLAARAGATGRQIHYRINLAARDQLFHSSILKFGNRCVAKPLNSGAQRTPTVLRTIKYNYRAFSGEQKRTQDAYLAALPQVKSYQ
jgi:hypothetical protein